MSTLEKCLTTNCKLRERCAKAHVTGLFYQVANHKPKGLVCRHFVAHEPRRRPIQASEWDRIHGRDIE